ncbi:hypothetical protein KSZ_22370 [Dictyobacter formicarum]|uniref:Uncharacterized protein n=1 Tax=Dictyobacter formicarum TaxID=2778368 RepID=A0ABQ3VEU9_9CHLR|nr:hypothetical protein KSZ_22370 [Dictyobacter formicarum]
MEYSIHGNIERVAGTSCDYCFAEWVPQVPAASCASDIFISGNDIANGIVNATVASASTQITLESAGEIRPFLIVKRCRRHDHTSCTKATLKGLSIKKGLLYWVQHTVLFQSLNCRNLVVGGAKGRNEAAMHRHTVKPDGTRAAVTRVTSFFDTEEAAFTQKGS